MTPPYIPIAPPPIPLRVTPPPMAVPPVVPRPPGLLERLRGGLFPVPNTGGLLGSGDQSALQQQALFQLGLGLLGQSGPRVRGTPGSSFGERLAGAFQGVNFPQMIQGAQQQALLNRQIQQEEATRAAIDRVAKKYAEPEGRRETEQERFDRAAGALQELMMIPGAERILGPGSNLVAQLRPVGDRDRGHFEFAVDENGRSVLLRASSRPGGQIDVLPFGQPTRQLSPEGFSNIAVPGELGPETWQIGQRSGTVRPVIDPRTGKPMQRVLTEAQISQGALLAPAELADHTLSGLLAPNRIQQLTASKGLNEFLNANAELLENSSNAIAEARVYGISGKAVREQEFDRTKRLITPRAGDSEESLAWKAMARKLIIASIRRASGRLTPPSEAISSDDIIRRVNEIMGYNIPLEGADGGQRTGPRY